MWESWYFRGLFIPHQQSCRCLSAICKTHPNLTIVHFSPSYSLGIKDESYFFFKVLLIQSQHCYSEVLLPSIRKYRHFLNTQLYIHHHIFTWLIIRNNCCLYSQYGIDCLGRQLPKPLEIKFGNFFSKIDEHFLNQSLTLYQCSFGFHPIRKILLHFINFMKLLHNKQEMKC